MMKTGTPMQLDTRPIIFVRKLGRYSKMPDDAAHQIRILLRTKTVAQIAEQFGVSTETIRNVIKKNNLVRPWRHLRT